MVEIVEIVDEIVEGRKEGSTDREWAIQECLRWMNKLRPGGAHKFHQIEFRSSISENGVNMVGVYATEDILDSSTLSTDDENEKPPLFVVPNECVLHVEHPRVKGGHIESIVKQIMKQYESQVDQEYNNEHKKDNPWDIYYEKNKGKVLVSGEIRLMMMLTLVLYAKETDTGSILKNAVNNKEQQQGWLKEAIEVATFWNPFLDTWPENFATSVFQWEDEEIHNLRGTSCHSLVQRLRKERDDNYRILLDVTGMNNKSDDDDIITNRVAGMQLEPSLSLFRQCYDRAVAGVYSRMQGVESQSEKLIPLLDLINGARRDDELMIKMMTANNNSKKKSSKKQPSGQIQQEQRCNIELLEYPDYISVMPMSSLTMNKQASPLIPAGDELFFDYGPNPTINYITKFGYVPLYQGLPLLHPADSVFLVPPISLLPTSKSKNESTKFWNAVEKATNGVTEEHIQYANQNLEECTPFVLFGNIVDVHRIRREILGSDDAYIPEYLNRQISFITLLLTRSEDIHVAENDEVSATSSSVSSSAGADPYIEPWETGHIWMQMIDMRLKQLPNTDDVYTTSQKKDYNWSQENEKKEEEATTTASPNMITGTRYRMIERELLSLWRHAIAVRYELYEEKKDGNTVLDEYVVDHQQTNKNDDEPKKNLSSFSGSCAVCRATFRIKNCTRCKKVDYCNRMCQIEDWKFGGHNKACKKM